MLINVGAKGKQMLYTWFFFAFLEKTQLVVSKNRLQSFSMSCFFDHGVLGAVVLLKVFL